MRITREDRKWLIDIADTFERDQQRDMDGMYILYSEKAEEIIERIRKMTKRRK